VRSPLVTSASCPSLPGTHAKIIPVSLMGHVAPDEATVRAHAQKGGFPANSVTRVRSVIDPTTAEIAP
jgi:hypothetical protein